MSGPDMTDGTARPALTPSLAPSDPSGEGLPYGPPPARLLEIESRSGPVAEDIRIAVRSLAENANRITGRSPLTAAACWHEAGRLLDRRARRPADAWTCHSRALALHPDHKPALDALRRLARTAGDVATLGRIIDAGLDRSHDPVESAALWTERAALQILEGNAAGAADALRQAVRVRPDTLLAQILRVVTAVRQADDAELSETLDALSERWTEPEGAFGLRLGLALVEERLGHLDKALERLEKCQGESPLFLAAQMARARVAIRLSRPEPARDALHALASRLPRPMASAFERYRAAVDRFALGADPSLESAGSPMDFVAMPGGIESLGTAALATAVRGREASRRAGRDVDVPVGIGSPSPFGKALANFLGATDARRPEGDAPPSDEADRLDRALARGEPEQAAEALSRLRQSAADPDEHWSLAVAEASVRVERLGQTERALALLRQAAGRLDAPPLPSFLRRYARDDRTLADLAIAEADSAEDAARKACLYAWAAVHLVGIDVEESRRLHRRALEIDPTCRMSISALEAVGADHSALAVACAAAGKVAPERHERARFLLRAGVHHLLAGDLRSVLAVWREALSVVPGDSQLWMSVLRLSLDHTEDIAPDDLRRPPGVDEPDPTDMMALGSLCLAVDPAQAARWFERLHEADPWDPLAEAALREARLMASRSSLVSGGLLEKLREAASPEEEAMVYQRLADLDARYNRDVASSICSLVSLEQNMPGHRPTLVKLALHFLAQRREDDLARVLGRLARVVSDDALAAAMADTARDLGAADKDLLHLSVVRDPNSLLGLVEMEGRTRDVAERAETLASIVRLLPRSAVHASRLADALEDMGRYDEAIAERVRAIGIDGASDLDMLGILRAQKVQDNPAAVLDTLCRIADRTRLKAHREADLLEAARIARDEVSDWRRAAELCLEVLERNPENVEAFSMGREILERMQERVLMTRLLQARTRGAKDTEEQRRLRLALTDVLLDLGERAGAKEQLAEAIALAPMDVASRVRLADLHREDGEWDSAIGQLMEAARLVTDPERGIPVFMALGEITHDHTERKDLAEKSFIKVLGWDKTHFGAVERLARLYADMGNWQRAAQAEERLAHLATEPSIKVEKMVALARILELHLGRSKDAENMLEQARRISPFDYRPIEGLADLYERQKASLALSVHLDRSLAAQAAALVETPGETAICRNIQRILVRKSEHALASMAAAALRAMGYSDDGDPPIDVPETVWDVGNRIGDPVYEDYLCPKELAPAMRETLRAAEETVGRLTGTAAKSLGLPRDARLDRKTGLGQAFGSLTPAFGVPEPTVYMDPRVRGIRLAPGSPAAVIVPEAAARTTDAAVHRFVAATSLQMLRAGLCLATVMPEERLRVLIAALVRLSVPAFQHASVDESAVAATSAELKTALPSRTVERIAPFAFDCATVLDHPDIVGLAHASGHRAGFMAAGSLTSALAGLRAADGGTGLPFQDLPGFGRMLAFAFGKDHMELRERLGL